MAGLTVDFNNLRLNVGRAYNNLVIKLHAKTGDWGTIRVHKDDLTGKMNDLRAMIGAIMSVYEPSRPDFRDVTDDLTLIPFDGDDENDDEDGDEPGDV